MKTKPNVIKSILLSLLFYLIFVVVFFLSIMVITFALGLLVGIPAFGKLVASFSNSMLFLSGAPMICCYLAVSAALYLPDKLKEDSSTLSLSVLLCGIYIIAVSACFLVLNIIAHDAFWPNIVQIITGIIVLKSSKEF